MPEYEPYTALTGKTDIYKVILLRDQRELTFSNIAREVGSSVQRVSSLYWNGKYRQVILYIGYLSEALDIDILKLEELERRAYSSYRREHYVCDYFEREYKEQLEKYRHGEPGMREEFVRSIPPLTTVINETAVRCIVMGRERGESWQNICEKLRLTPERAQFEYDNYYRVKAEQIFQKLYPEGLDRLDNLNLWYDYFRAGGSSKRTYEILLGKLTGKGNPQVDNGE